MVFNVVVKLRFRILFVLFKIEIKKGNGLVVYNNFSLVRLNNGMMCF